MQEVYFLHIQHPMKNFFIPQRIKTTAAVVSRVSLPSQSSTPSRTSKSPQTMTHDPQWQLLPDAPHIVHIFFEPIIGIFMSIVIFLFFAIIHLPFFAR